MSPCSELAGDRRGGESGVAACSVPSPSSSPRRKTIEDVWRDVSLSFFRKTDTQMSIPAAIFQDCMPDASKRSRAFPSPPAAALPRPPATCLTLASGCADTARHDQAPYVLLTTSSSGPNHTNSGKRRAEMKDEPPDQRHKRLIKNRESAARSRARRQAYTTELEMEIERLKKENAYLRRQQEKILSTASSATPERNKLRRTLTGPF